MNKIERQVIYNKYSQLGLSKTECNARIKEFKKYSKGFVKLQKENEKLRNKIIVLEERLKILKGDKPKPVSKKQGVDIFNEDITKSELKKNKKFINRILNNIEKDKEYSKTYFKKEMLIPEKIIPFCLKYLIDEKKIEQIIQGRNLKYRLI